MNKIIELVLGSIAKGLDSIPWLKGHRTTAVGILIIVGSVSSYLAGQINAEQAGLAIAAAIQAIYAAKHKT